MGKKDVEKIVIALGGNAILQPGQRGTYEEQLKNVERACEQIAELVVKGFNIVLTHGNGPQVGNILIQNEQGAKLVPSMPLDVCGAQSQGMIGYMLQRTLKKALANMGCKAEIATIITQVVVDRQDPSFGNPSKPVGPFYNEETAKAKMAAGESWIEDANRGWRKVVPSPEPQKIVEAEVIKKLIEAGVLVIASGGGGIPVVEESDGVYRGVEAVIDKDLAGQRLATEIGADMFIILTDVPGVAINYRKENESWLRAVSLEEIRRYEAEGHFKKGSMNPKVKACLRFAELTNKPAVIASLDKLLEAIEGKSGTRFLPS
ncbi:MAG: carbamate kinase [Peptococcaceae bacterium]|jgi:carbamate kinase|nr:carbamate kinase [Peptococcaceae bacterium]